MRPSFSPSVPSRVFGWKKWRWRRQVYSSLPQRRHSQRRQCQTRTPTPNTNNVKHPKRPKTHQIRNTQYQRPIPLSPRNRRHHHQDFRILEQKKKKNPQFVVLPSIRLIMGPLPHPAYAIFLVSRLSSLVSRERGYPLLFQHSPTRE